MRSPLFVLACAGALAVSGCGGGDEGATTAAQDEQPARSTKAGDSGRTGEGQGTNAVGGGSQQSPASSGGNAEGATPPPDAGPTPGSRQAAAGVPVNPGGDNSVQTYGTEAANAERRGAVTTLQVYLDARAAGLWAQACLRLAASTRTEIGSFPERGGGGEGLSGCPQGLKALTEGVPPASLRASARIDPVLSFRTQGAQGFLLFNGPPDTTLYATTMVREDGEWKVATLVPFPLSV